MLKKFREILGEMTTENHHAEATKIVRAHSKGVKVENASHDFDDGGKHHLSAVHPDHVSKLHSALESAGFKKHAKTSGMPNQGGPNSTSGHVFQKGKTKVHVATSKDTYGKHETDDNTHHSVEVHTTHHVLGEEADIQEMATDWKRTKGFQKSLSEEYKPEEGHKVKIIGKGMEHTGKVGHVHQVSPSGTHAGVKDKKGKHIGYYHASDLKQMNDED